MKVLVVDDHPDALDALAAFVADLGHRVTTAGNGSEALAQARNQRPDLIISDLRMPGMDGLQLMAALEEFESPPPIALVTAFAEADVALEAMRQGACDFIRKPVDVRDIHRLIERISHNTRIAQRALTEPEVLVPQSDGLLVAGPAMAAVVALADRLHQFPSMPALIEAETGCGKELIARRIHHGGQPADLPFLAVNCAAIPPGLFEAEVFGYAPGAFTGASPGGSQGLLAQAGAGTLFLDEIGELPLDQQAKLLRVLEERIYHPVGGTRQMRLQARVICATNRDLFREAGEGRFRNDLLYRLKVGYVRIPPLRERREEILPLAHAFVRAAVSIHGRGFTSIDAAAAARLRDGSWPGNVRQLRHALDRALLLRGPDELVLAAELLDRAGDDSAPGRAIRTPAPAASIELTAQPPTALVMPERQFDFDGWQKAMVAAALQRCQGSPVRTSAYLGLSRKVLYTLRRRYGLMEDR